MTQPPLKIERRWVALVGFLILATLVVVVIIKCNAAPEPALIAKLSSELGNPDFSHPQYSPSELVTKEELLGPLRAEGFADAIGLGKGVRPSVVTPLPPLNDEKLFAGVDPMDQPHGQRRVTDGKLTFIFWDYCGPSSVVVSDETGKRIAKLSVPLHAHTTGVVAPDRGLLVATCGDAKIESWTGKVNESQAVVFDYRNEKELGVFHMPLTYFKTLAISRDEKWLFVGFGDGSIRRFEIDSAKPRWKKSG